MSELDGWQADPFGRHEGRFFSGGKPTNRVRDGNTFSFEGRTARTRSQASDAVVWETPEPPPAGGPLSFPAAWYSDPTIAGVLRYWDGSHWTGQVTTDPASRPTGTPLLPHEDEWEHPPTTGVVGERPISGADTVEVAIPPETAADARTQVAVPEQATRQQEAETSARPPPPAGPFCRAVRGPHYVVAPPAAASALVGPEPEPVSIVTGEVPQGYGRITVECEDGDVIEATILGPVDGVIVFAALVRHRVRRIVASEHNGISGVFLDVGLLEREADRR